LLVLASINALTQINSELITAEVGDSRYGREYFQLITSPIQSNTTAYVNGPSLILPAGSYDFEMFVMVEATGETAGSQSNVSCSPSTDVSMFQDTRVNNINALGTGAAPNASFRKGTGTLGAADFISAFCEAPNNYATTHCRGSTVLASETTINLRIKQRGAGDAANPARISTGSFMRFTKR
jgi:hypothetical protein